MAEQMGETAQLTIPIGNIHYDHVTNQFLLSFDFRGESG